MVYNNSFELETSKWSKLSMVNEQNVPIHLLSGVISGSSASVCFLLHLDVFVALLVLLIFLQASLCEGLLRGIVHLDTTSTTATNDGARIDLIEFFFLLFLL